MDKLNIFSLQNKVAVITGASGFLGESFSNTLLQAGAIVHLIDINLTQLQTVEKKLNSEMVHIHQCDITNEDEVKDTIKNILNKSSKIDILVNSAAIDPKMDKETTTTDIPGKFTEYSSESFLDSLKVNLLGCFLITKYVCRYMETVQTGSIINISSIYGIAAPDPNIYKDKNQNQILFKPVDYSTTKAGVIGFTKSLAATFSGTNIRVNTLVPGGTFNNNPEHFKLKYSDKTILKRMGKPDDYDGALIFLASDASSYVTGATIVVDGGYSTL